QVTEHLVAERIVAHVLNKTPAIRIGMGLAQLYLRCHGKLLLQQGLDLVSPQQINDLFMRKNGVSMANLRKAKDNQQRSHHGSNYVWHDSFSVRDLKAAGPTKT